MSDEWSCAQLGEDREVYSTDFNLHKQIVHPFFWNSGARITLTFPLYRSLKDRKKGLADWKSPIYRQNLDGMLVSPIVVRKVLCQIFQSEPGLIRALCADCLRLRVVQTEEKQKYQWKYRALYNVLQIVNG